MQGCSGRVSTGRQAGGPEGQVGRIRRCVRQRPQPGVCRLARARQAKEDKIEQSTGCRTGVLRAADGSREARCQAAQLDRIQQGTIQARGMAQDAVQAQAVRAIGGVRHRRGVCQGGHRPQAQVGEARQLLRRPLYGQAGPGALFAAKRRLCVPVRLSLPQHGMQRQLLVRPVVLPEPCGVQQERRAHRGGRG